MQKHLIPAIFAHQIAILSFRSFYPCFFRHCSLMKIIVYTYNIIVGASFLISLLSFRFHYAWHLRFFSLLLGITFFVEASTMYMVKVAHVKSDLWVYNIFMAVEYTCYAYYYLLVLKTKWIRKMATIFLIVYPATGIISTFAIFKFFNWNSYEAITGSFFTILFSVIFYYELYMSSDNEALIKNSEFWIATGMIIFYALLLPFVGVFNFLGKTSKELASFFAYGLQFLGIFMYVLFSYAFLCRIIIKK